MHIANFMSAWPQRLLVVLALVASCQVHAFTLGRVQGAALIGRPLEVTIQVQLNPGQSMTSACFTADVFHGDTRQSPAGVKATFEPATSALGARLRVTSNSRIDEPVVTVYVRAGCDEMLSRRYVLLADIVSEQSAAPMPLVDPTRFEAPADVAPSAASQRKSQAAPVASPAKRAAESRPARARAPARSRPAAAAPKAAAPQSGAAAAPATPAPVAGAGQSRLRLDPLEMLSERVATLESNKTTTPAQLSEREIRDAERLERLETSVKALLALAEKNEASLRDVRSRMARAQEDGFSSTLVYALFGLLLLCLLAIAYLLTRVSRRPEVEPSRWYEGESELDGQNTAVAAAAVKPDMQRGVATPAKVVVAPVSEPAPLPSTDRTPLEETRPMPHDVSVRASAEAGGPVDVNLVEMSASTFDRLMQSSGAHSAVRDSRQARDTVPMAMAKVGETAQTQSMARRARINSDELIDVRQRAEFFVSLGQTDQAVEVLEERIALDGASSPQAYLDLLKLFHSLGLKADFKLVADDFVGLFNVQLPEFAQFDEEGLVLEEYPGEVDRLIAAWGKPTVLETIEQLVFRNPQGDGTVAFDLAAFRDLLMLHAVAQSVGRGAVGRPGATGARAPIEAPASASQVDIDLSELFAPDGAPTVSLPQIDAEATVSQAPASAPKAEDEHLGNLIDFDLGDVEFGDKDGKNNKDGK